MQPPAQGSSDALSSSSRWWEAESVCRLLRRGLLPGERGGPVMAIYGHKYLKQRNDEYPSVEAPSGTLCPVLGSPVQER